MAATLASVSCEMPWSCMYRLIFMPKNLVVRNWPFSPYQRRHVDQRGVDVERAARVLVHADGDADVVVARPDGVGAAGGAGRGGAGVEHVHERDAGQSEQADDRVGVGDLPAAAEGELDVVQSTPASATGEVASAPMSNADLSPNRPNGCSPTPMIATSSIQ